MAGSGWRFNPPPGWPPPPPGWVPPPDFRGDPSWPSPPEGWQWWVPQSLVPAQRQPIPQAQWAAAPTPAAGSSRRRSWRTAYTVLLSIGAVLVLVALVFAAVVTPVAKPVAQSQPAQSAPQVQSAPEVQPSSAASDPVAPPSPSPSPSASAVAVAPAHGLVVVGGVALPDRALTPGEVFVGATSSIICVSGYSSRVRHVTASEYVSVYAAYRIGYPAPTGSYELDHLIPLELGGDNSTRNLWPEPRAVPGRGFPTKDQLENRLHNLVCAHQLSLATAQQAIATNWYAAYRLYGGATYAYSAPAPAPPPQPQPTYVAPPPGGGDQGVVHPGAFCAPAGATGHTSIGTPMVCGAAADGKNRWHRA